MSHQDRIEDEALEYAANLPAPPKEPPMLALISRMATDPSVDVDKLQKLLEMQERIDDRQRAAEFAEALAALQPMLPRIKKDGRIEIPAERMKSGKAAKIPYATWENIDTAIRPLLAEKGFGLSFRTDSRQGEGGGLIVTARLRHRNGHFEECSIPVPLDTGPGRNNLQAYGSSLSYGKRYTASAILNLVTEGEDDDGQAGGRHPISAEQLKTLTERCKHLGVAPNTFCRTLAVEALSDLDQSAFPIAMNLLDARERRRTDNERAAGREEQARWRQDHHLPEPPGETAPAQAAEGSAMPAQPAESPAADQIGAATEGESAPAAGADAPLVPAASTVEPDTFADLTARLHSSATEAEVRRLDLNNGRVIARWSDHFRRSWRRQVEAKLKELDAANA